MPDPVAITPTIDPTLSKVAADVGSDVPLVRQAISDLKTGGVSAVAKDLPLFMATLGSQLADFKAAVPVIKAGYKTTEFWLTAAFVLGNTVFMAMTKTVVPFDTNVVLGAVIAIYAAVRALTKK